MPSQTRPARAVRSVLPVLLATLFALALTSCSLLPERGADGSATASASPTAASPSTNPGTEPAPPKTVPSSCPENTSLPSQRLPRTRTAMLGTSAARAALSRLRTAERTRGDDFCRAAFGPSTWPDLDGNGCSARQDTLRRGGRDLVVGVIRSHGTGCREVLSGTWVDAYTGETLPGPNMKDPTIAATIQIDHLVSLFNAWISGAREWPPQRRVQFANDTSIHELYAVSAATNFAKSYRGAESWRPPAAYQCRFARSYVEVKASYDLTVTAAEREALSDMLDTC